VGDVEFDAACRRAGFISPVPGGVGPLTRIILIENLIRLHEIQELHRETERFLRGNR
jgi:methylenetetrahydrofolate dehydrogenase (NADP+)/methenyltetrahydrofolate cyclohydrolase